MAKFVNGIIALCLAAAWPLSAHAARFTNQFVEFELPPKWQCSLEGAEWVCQSTEAEKKRDAIIILAAKLKGDQDSIDQYLAYLKQAKSYTSVKGKPIRSEAKYAKVAMINEHNWVDALHLESEIPGFYTRYLATIKQDIGVLVTYSINKDKYSQYLNDFEAMVKTIRVFRKAGAINAAGAGTNLFNNAAVPNKVNPGSVFGNIDLGDDEPQQQRPVKKEEFPIAYVLVGVGLLGFIIWKRRQG